MNAARILPDLQCSLICEDVRQEINGNFILVGVLNYVQVPKFPVTALKLCVYNRWTAGVGTFVESCRLIAPDQTTVLRKGEVKFGLHDPALHSTNVTVWGQVKFDGPGTYFVEVLVDDVMKLRYPLTMHLAPPPPGQQQAGPAPAGPAPQA